MPAGNRMVSPAWIIENIAGDLKVETLAEKAGMSPRTFARAYTSRTGMTPASGVEALRVETARLLLESSEIRGVVEVARRAGFGDDERMRRAFIRHLGISPSEYRSRFSGRAEQLEAGDPRAEQA